MMTSIILRPLSSARALFSGCGDKTFYGQVRLTLMVTVGNCFFGTPSELPTVYHKMLNVGKGPRAGAVTVLRLRPGLMFAFRPNSSSFLDLAEK